MLQHDPNSSQDVPDAAHTRVKVDVLAKAIAVIEERRQEQARQMEGTALIGDVVRDLQVDATPEELLAEVEAQQKAALFSWNNPAQEDAFAGARTQRRAEQQNKTFWMTARISIAWVAAIIFVIWFVSSLSSSDPDPNRHVYMPPVLTYTPHDTTPPPTRPFFPTGPPVGMLPAQMEYQRGGPAHALADIADGHPFGCSTDTLQSLLRHEPMSDIYLYDAERDMTYDQRKPGSMRGLSLSQGNSVGPLAWSSWTLIKHNGQVYLRGWIEQDTAQQLTSQKVVSVFNLQAPMKDMGRFMPITLPLATVNAKGLYQSVGNISDGSHFSYPSRLPAQELLVQGLPLDKYAHEKWQP